MGKITRIAIAVIVGIFCISSALAKDNGERFVENFATYCVYSAPAFEKLEAAAKIEKWRPLSKDESHLLGPVDENSQFKGWYVQKEKSEDGYYVGFSEGIINGEHVKACAVTSQRGEWTDIDQTLIQTNLIGKQIMNDIQGFQKTVAWEARLHGDIGLIYFISYKGKPGGVLSLVITEKNW